MSTSLKSLIGILIALLLGGAITTAGSTASLTIGGLPLYAICAVLAFTIQWAAFFPAWLFKTEIFYDLTGSLTYLTVIGLALYMSAAVQGGNEFDPRALMVSTLVFVWATRLGSFLFLRAAKTGGDSRFDKIKIHFMRFLTAWTLQGLWVVMTAACALAVITSNNPKPLDLAAWAGLGIWIIGFSIEVAADSQKSAFNRDPANQGKFVNIGLWRWSRHPNYFGEIVLWIGVTVIALPVLQGWQWLTLISPLFVVYLLTRLSGIPTLEHKADKKWEDDPEYQTYKAATPVLMMKRPDRE